MSKKDEIKKLEEEIKLQELKIKKKKLDDDLVVEEIDNEIEEYPEGFVDSFKSEFKRTRKRNKERIEEEKKLELGPSNNKGKQSEHDGIPCSNYHPGETHYAWRNSGSGCLWKLIKYFAIFLVIALILNCIGL